MGVDLGVAALSGALGMRFWPRMGSAWRWERLRRLTAASGLEPRLVPDGKEVGGFMVGVYGLTPTYWILTDRDPHIGRIASFKPLNERIKTLGVRKAIGVYTIPPSSISRFHYLWPSKQLCYLQNIHLCVLMLLDYRDGNIWFGTVVWTWTQQNLTVVWSKVHAQGRTGLVWLEVWSGQWFWEPHSNLNKPVDYM